MTKQQQVKIGLIAGIILITVYLLLSLFLFKCPTESQYTALRIIISLGAAAFAVIIPGFIEVKYKTLVSAGGAMAVFLLIFSVNPKPIKSLSECDNVMFIKGNVMLNGKPFEMAEISLLELDLNSIRTNENGTFTFILNGNVKHKELTVRIRSEAMNIDTPFLVSNFKEQMRFNLAKEVRPKEFCIQCIAKDSVQRIVNVKERCNPDSLYLVNYIAGFSQSSKQQRFTADCIWKN